MRRNTKENLLMLGSLLACFSILSGYIAPVFRKELDEESPVASINESVVSVGDPPVDNDSWWIYPELEPYQIYSAPQINWSKFWNIFKQNVLWRAEWYNPSTQAWVDGTDNLNINFKVVNESSRKLTLNFTTHPTITTDYRLILAANYRVKEYVNRSGNQEYTLSYEVENETFNLIFNWSDMLQYQNLIFHHGIKEVNGVDYFYFIVRKNDIPPNTFVSLDPTYTVYSGAGTGAYYAGQRKMARQSNGTLWCTFFENNDAHVAWSDDAGVNWNDIEVWGAQTSARTTIAVDSNDVVHLVFASNKNDADDTQLEYTNSSDWTTIVQIRDEDKMHDYPSIAVDSNDNIHIVYEKGEEGTSNDDQVAYINSTDGGATWGTEKILTDEANVDDDVWLSSIAIDTNDIIHVVYAMEDYSGGVDTIGHVLSSDKGDSWTDWESDIVLSGTGANERRPCLVITDSNDLMVTGDDTVYDTYYRYNGSSDNQWSNGGASHEIYSDGTYASISVVSNGSAYIVFEATSLNDIQYFHNFTGAGWVDGGVIAAGTYAQINTISAQHPVIDGAKTNRPATGFALIATETNSLIYYSSPDLTWEAGSGAEPWSNTCPVQSAFTVDGVGNASVGVSRYPQLNITVNDIDANNTIVYWSTNGSALYQINASAGNRTARDMNFSFASAYSTKYYVEVSVNDTWCNTSRWYCFTTVNRTWQNTSTGYLTGGNLTLNWNNISTGYLTGGNATLNWNNASTGYLTGGNVTINWNNVSTGFLTGGNVTSIWNNVSVGYLTGGNITSYKNISSGYLTGGNVTTAWNNVSSGYLTGGNITLVWNNVSTGYLTGGNISSVPQFSNEDPLDGAIIYVTSYNWCVTITDMNMFNWTIECNNSQNHSGTNDTNGTYWLNLSSLTTYTTYTVWVNVSNGYLSANASYIFTVMPAPSTPGGGGGRVLPLEEEDVAEPQEEDDSDLLTYSAVSLIGLMIVLFLYKRKKKKRKKL